MTIEKATSVKKKEVKTKIIYLGDAGNEKPLHWLLLSLACWLMLERRLCVYNARLKVDMSWEILTVIMTSYYENVHSWKTHSSSSHVLFLAICFALSCPRDSLPWVLIGGYCSHRLSQWKWLWKSLVSMRGLKSRIIFCFVLFLYCNLEKNVNCWYIS